MDKKMLLAILEDTNSRLVLENLYQTGFPLTIIDSTAGFLRQGKSTLIAGVDQKDIDCVIDIIDQQCKPSANPFQKRATVMVFNLDHFEQIP
jgi:uncharacterized protein YaaQ